ncbi:hypothetical protein [Salana multivorans]
MSALTPHPGEASPFDAIRQTREDAVAREVVARRIIHDALAYYGEDGDEWEGYPEVGEDDWKLIAAAVRDTGDQYRQHPDVIGQALRVLTDRAEAS